jgi:4'-phosphopantetheinyl transferase
VSVSHSGLLVVVALSTRGPVGVDVQRVADMEDPAAAPEWVRREALFKARSGGPAAGGSVHELEAPLAGYAAAAALPAGDDRDVVVLNWP